MKLSNLFEQAKYNLGFGKGIIADYKYYGEIEERQGEDLTEEDKEKIFEEINKLRKENAN